MSYTFKINRVVVLNRNIDKLKELMKEYHMENCPDDMVEEVFNSTNNSEPILFDYLDRNLGSIDLTNGATTKHELSEDFIEEIVRAIGNDLTNLSPITNCPENENPQMIGAYINHLFDTIRLENEFNYIPNKLMPYNKIVPELNDMVEYILYYISNLRNLQAKFNIYLSDLKDKCKTYERYYEFEA